MRVLVTGGQGCIGAWVVKQLLDQSIEVVTYDLNPDPNRLALLASGEEISRIEFHIGSIEDTNQVKKLVRDRGVTHIVHLAGVLIPFCQANPAKGASVNVIGTLNIFEAARDAGRPVRIVYASSAAVWGPEEVYGDRTLSESDTLLPKTHYGVFKQANEGNARVFFLLNEISSIGLRPWAVYGVGRDSGLTADPTLAAKAVVLKRPFRIRISGSMEMQYVGDVAATFIRCLLSDLSGAHVFHIPGEIVEMNEVVRLLNDLRPQAAGLITVSGDPIPVTHKLDSSNISKMITGIPKASFRDGLEQTLLHYERLRRDGLLDDSLVSS